MGEYCEYLQLGGNGQTLIPESRFIGKVIELKWNVTDVIDLFHLHPV